MSSGGRRRSAGILVMFDTEDALSGALERLRADAVGELRTYTPKPLESEPAASPLPMIVLLAGIVGAAGGFGMQVYATMIGYPLDIGGRPEYSWPAYIPIAFELGVLFAVLAGVLGYFALNRMPRLYEPIDELDSMREVMRDGWVVVICTKDPKQLAQARAIIEKLSPLAIEEVGA